jgi:fructose-1,6-bisphosphatase/inositol monophosphatase family enzyme
LNPACRPRHIAKTAKEDTAVTTHPDLSALLLPVIAAAEAAGRLLAEEFVRPDGPHGEAGHADVDDEIEVVLREQLLDLFPARWLGEETGAQVGPGGAWCWLVDPHDGTDAFLAGERGSAVSIALLRNGVPVLGVVHAPLPPDRSADTIVWAEGLDHLLRNAVPVEPALADSTLSAGAIVFVSQAAPEWPIGNARAVAPARFVALPSIAYRLARAAAGDGVAAVSLNNPCGWDYAAGHALIRGAGGVLLDEAGREVTYTVDGRSSTRWCFGGAPLAARDLAARDWHRVHEGARMARRTVLGWPRYRAGTTLDRASVVCSDKSRGILSARWWSSDRRRISGASIRTGSVILPTAAHGTPLPDSPRMTVNSPSTSPAR